MGPFRRQLTGAALILALAPTSALAGVCDKIRPGWDLAQGPVGLLGETVFVLSSFPGLVVLAFLAFGLARPSLWISTACAVPAMAFGALLALSQGTEGAKLALAEGCVGNAFPIALVLIGLGGLTVLRAWRAS